jgi:lipopolysaccharide export system protein LptC
VIAVPDAGPIAHAAVAQAAAAPSDVPPTALGQRRHAASAGITQRQGRSSRLVMLMKLLLPAIAAGLIGLIVAWPQLRTDNAGFRVGSPRVNPGEAEIVRMTNARFQGADERGQPYVVTSLSATQPTGSNNVVIMDAPKADITTTDGAWVALTAESGIYYRDQHKVDLSGSVNIFHDQGYEFRSSAAAIDLKAGTASGHQRVEGQGPFGQVVAEGFQILDRGHRLIFTGRTRLVMSGGGERPLEARRP